MIPTEYKSKLPKTLSYPVAAKAISAALTDVPQSELLKINFWYRKGFAKDRVIGAPYQVIEASYSGPGVLSGWIIQVYPVPCPLKHVIQVKLIADALPQIRDWLKANFHSTDREGGHDLAFFFDELKDEIVSEERSSTVWKTERA